VQIQFKVGAVNLQYICRAWDFITKNCVFIYHIFYASAKEKSIGAQSTTALQTQRGKFPQIDNNDPENNVYVVMSIKHI